MDIIKVKRPPIPKARKGKGINIKYGLEGLKHHHFKAYPKIDIKVEAIKAPYITILDNAGYAPLEVYSKGWGINVVTGKPTNMIKAGVIDPVLVTKTALKNAVSVATTIFSADCVISNMRTNAGD